jgi:hypothetical protein
MALVHGFCLSRPIFNCCGYVTVIVDAWDITRKLTTPNADVSQNSGRLVVQLTPAAPQYDLPDEGQDWYRNCPNLGMRAFLQPEGIPNQDLLSGFRPHTLAAGVGLYLSVNSI